MPFALCLIANPAHTHLDARPVAMLARVLDASPRWLAKAEACEFLVDVEQPDRLLRQAREVLAGVPFDVAVVPVADRIKRLLVSDMDSTVITVECIDELAAHLGIRDEVAAITRRAMNGELDFRAALEARVALLKGLPVTVFEEVLRERVRLTPGARTLVQTMRAHGATTALVSGGFLEFVEWVREAAGFDLAEANRLEVRDGRLTGHLLPPIHCPSSKLALLERLTRELGLRREETLAVGDGANDLPMLEAAGLGVAYRPHRSVAERIAVTIEHADLTALLYLQGIPKSAFVRD